MARVVGGNPHLEIAGQRQHGGDVRTQNATAVMSIANVVKTSLGPVGLDKVSTIRSYGVDKMTVAIVWGPDIAPCVSRSTSVSSISWAT